VIRFPQQLHSILASLPGSLLLESSRPDSENSRSYLFLHPLRILSPQSLGDIPALFQSIEDSLAQGLFVAGFLSYECGFHFEPSAALRPPALSSLPLAWFGVYQHPFVFDHSTGAFTPALPPQFSQPSSSSPAFSVSGHHLPITQSAYCEKIEAIRDFIAAGDTYQLNFTTPSLFDFSGSPAALFSHLRNQQKVPFAAFLHLPHHDILSFSPELFFRIHNNRITTRPMKGTAPRGRTLAEDSQLIDWLHNDPKNRAENVMIVDLLRNDLGKISQTGSVRTDNLFAVEKYQTLLQMTSTVSGTLLPNTSFYDIFRALFPSGSVTGAPKCRTMQLIQQLESSPRGVYTGAIGFFSPNRDAVFSVPIRTIVLQNSSGQLGVGSGITYDSVPDQEYAECLLKLQFFTRSQQDFQLIESLLWNGQYLFLPQHLARLQSSAEYFDFPFRAPDLATLLENNQRHLHPSTHYKVRLLLDSDGQATLDNVPIASEPPPSIPIGTVSISPLRTHSHDPFLFHKTTHRPLYEQQLSQATQEGHVDILFLNEREELTEAVNNNLFVEIAGKLYTPPLTCGLLPGIYRHHLLQTDPSASERILSLADLRSASALFLSNSVRGLRQVTLGA